jgi:hypothetical protein
MVASFILPLAVHRADVKMDRRTVGLATEGLQTELADWDAVAQLYKADAVSYSIHRVRSLCSAVR